VKQPRRLSGVSMGARVGGREAPGGRSKRNWRVVLLIRD
jgi:hypothetical protein